MFSIKMSNPSQIRHIAIQLLARRDHSRLELQKKLLERSFSREEIDALLPELIEKNLLNDVRFAQSYIRMRTAKGYGAIRIAEELRERGIDKEIISTELDDPMFDIEKVCIKKFGTKNFKDLNSRAKAIRFLQYRGFSFEQINRLLKDSGIS
jgi:regulatory protein